MINTTSSPHFFLLKKGVIPFDVFWKQNTECLRSCIISFMHFKTAYHYQQSCDTTNKTLKGKINISFFHNNFKQFPCYFTAFYLYFFQLTLLHAFP